MALGMGLDFFGHPTRAMTLMPMGFGALFGMWAAMMPLGAGPAALVGMICGLIGIVIIWILNNTVRGARRYGAED